MDKVSEPEPRKCVYTDKTKDTIFRWRAKNKDKFLEMNRRHCKDYYERNKETILQKQRERYRLKKAKQNNNK